MEKKEIAAAFSEGNFEICFGSITDKTFWNTPGEQFLSGKTEIEAFCKKTKAYFDSMTTHFKQLNLIENDCCVVINGTAEFIRDGKLVSSVSSCDVYEFDDNDKLISIHSYCIPEEINKDQNQFGD